MDALTWPMGPVLILLHLLMRCTPVVPHLDTLIPALLHQVGTVNNPILIVFFPIQAMQKCTCLYFCPDGFYTTPPPFDASAAYIPPPPYSAPLGQQPPHDQDLPSSAAGDSLLYLLLTESFCLCSYNIWILLFFIFELLLIFPWKTVPWTL